jgi:cell division protease FtsH
VGNISYYNPQGNGFNKPYSEDTARIIDEEVKSTIEVQYQRAIQILTDNKDKLEKLAEILLQKEVIFKEDLEKIFGKRAFGEHVIEAPEVTDIFNDVPEGLKPDGDNPIEPKG